ncbi:pyruvate, phosphate dikinase [Thermaurantiacus sp.]
MILPITPDLVPDPAILGGKAASLVRMARLGLPVPPAFVVPAAVSRERRAGDGLPPGLGAGLRDGISWLERETGRRFGGNPPLLVSVRSGAAVSMPGMMDTLLNVGLDAGAHRALAAQAGGGGLASTLATTLAAQFRDLIGPLPADPFAQLEAAVVAVLDSWNSRRARRYREAHGISHALGTAVTVQAMVFGNLGDRSGTGVLFTRNPLDGAPTPFGEWLPQAQGEAIVSGARTPQPLAALAEAMPEVHAALLAAGRRLEREERDAQDIEFTVEDGTLYLLQARTAKRAPAAALRMAVEMEAEGLVPRAEALARVTEAQLAQLVRPILSVTTDVAPLARGTPASPGAGAGRAVADGDALARLGAPAVLVRPLTSPEDVPAMMAAAAVVTAEGGATSHAAVVGRALGKPVVTGCGAAVLSLMGRQLTVCGSSGRVFDGLLPLAPPAVSPELRTYRGWLVEAGDKARLDAIGGGAW